MGRFVGTALLDALGYPQELVGIQLGHGAADDEWIDVVAHPCLDLHPVAFHVCFASHSWAITSKLGKWFEVEYVLYPESFKHGSKSIAQGRCHQSGTIGPSPLQASENKTRPDLTLQISRHKKADVKSASSFQEQGFWHFDTSNDTFGVSSEASNFSLKIKRCQFYGVASIQQFVVGIAMQRFFEFRRSSYPQRYPQRVEVPVQVTLRRFRQIQRWD